MANGPDKDDSLHTVLLDTLYAVKWKWNSAEFVVAQVRHYLCTARWPLRHAAPPG